MDAETWLQQVKVEQLKPKINVTGYHNNSLSFYKVGIVFLLDETFNPSRMLTSSSSKYHEFLRGHIDEVNRRLLPLSIICYLIGFQLVRHFQPNESLVEADYREFQHFIQSKLEPVIEQQFLTVLGSTRDEKLIVYRENFLQLTRTGQCKRPIAVWFVDTSTRDKLLLLIVLCSIGLLEKSGDNCCPHCFTNLHHHHLDRLSKKQLACLVERRNRKFESLHETCFKNTPDRVGDQLCGNGIYEGNEDCDCYLWPTDCIDCVKETCTRPTALPLILGVVATMAFPLTIVGSLCYLLIHTPAKRPIRTGTVESLTLNGARPPSGSSTVVSFTAYTSKSESADGAKVESKGSLFKSKPGKLEQMKGPLKSSKMRLTIGSELDSKMKSLFRSITGRKSKTLHNEEKTEAHKMANS